MSEFTEQYLIKSAERLSVDPEGYPRNIAIIMDGNGRWAQNKNLPRMKGHKKGGKTVEKIALDSVDLGFNSLTLYAFSSENWKRPKREIKALMNLYSQYLIGIRPMMMKNQVRLIHLGRLTNLPDSLKKDLADSIEMTKDNVGMILALALNYSGRDEIIDAVRNIAKEHKENKLTIEDIDQECISKNLYAPNLEEPDLLIRTASEMRISNFLLWQISYSEFHVTDTYWPDFNKSDLEKAIIDYSKRTRRFGNIEEK